MVSVLIAWLVFQKELDQKGHKIKVSITYSLLLRKQNAKFKRSFKIENFPFFLKFSKNSQWRNKENPVTFSQKWKYL